MSSDPTARLKALAEEGRRQAELRTKEEAKAVRAREAEADRQQKQLSRKFARRQQRKARLGPQGWVLDAPIALHAIDIAPPAVSTVTGLLFGASLITLSILVVLDLTDHLSNEVAAALALATVAGTGGPIFLLYRYFGFERQLRRLQSLPFPFDIDAYLRQLEWNRRTQHLVLWLEFEDSVASNERDLIDQAVRAAWPAARVEWLGRGAELQVSGAAEETFYQDDESLSITYTNRPLHSAFTEFAERCLPAIHAARPLIRLRTDIREGAP